MIEDHTEIDLTEGSTIGAEPSGMGRRIPGNQKMSCQGTFPTTSLEVFSTVEVSVVRIRYVILLSALVLAPVVGLAIQKMDTITLDSQVNLVVIRSENHISIQCSPTNTDTSTRPQWKPICNEMAAPQISKLVADGAKLRT